MKGKVFVIKDMDLESVDYFTKYSNDYLSKYDEMFMLMYCYLQRHRSIEGFVNMTIKDFLLYHNYIPDRNKGRANDKVRNILSMMANHGFIQYIGCYTYEKNLDSVECDRMFVVQLINTDEMWDPVDCFTKILYSEIDVLRKNKVKYMGKALSLYINIKRYISAKEGEPLARMFAFPSEDNLVKESSISKTSIKKYIKILCDLGLLYMKNFGSYKRLYKGKEEVVNSNNVYSLEEKYLDDNAKMALMDYLKNKNGFIGGFYPSTYNLPVIEKSMDNILQETTEQYKAV